MSDSKPKNETLAEHRHHCEAKIRCPFEAKADSVDDILDGNWTKRIRNTLTEYKNNGISGAILLDSLAFSDAVCEGKAKPFRLPPDLFSGDQEESGIPCWLSAAYHLASADEECDDKLVSNILCDFAKAFGRYSDSLRADCTKQYGDIFASGMEASVFDSGASDVIKVSSLELGSETSIQKVERLFLGNHFFPETKYTVEKLGKETPRESQVAFQLRQLKVEFAEKEISNNEIQRYLNSKGFVSKDSLCWTYESEDGSLACLDMHGENVVKTKSGAIVTIDPCIIPSTPELRFSVAGLSAKYDYDRPPAKLFCK